MILVRPSSTAAIGRPWRKAATYSSRRSPYARASSLAVAAWEACGLEGYGRVDMRLDETGSPFILEVNANPCLSADAGFMAAAGRAGLTAGDVVARILEAALRR